MSLSLRALRYDRNWTQQEVADRIGVSKETYGNYERGITFPDVPIIENILSLYGVKYDLVRWVGVEKGGENEV
jgi:putative transcriptional regulator